MDLILVLHLQQRYEQNQMALCLVVVAVGESLQEVLGNLAGQAKIAIAEVAECLSKLFTIGVLGLHYDTLQEICLGQHDHGFVSQEVCFG